MNSVKHSTAHDAASPDKGLDALATAERAAVRARREAVLNDAASPHAAAPRVTPGGALSGALSDTQRAAELALPRVGLALSGGGVRSATFGLGLLRGLAQSRPAGAAVTPAPPNPHDAPPEREPVTAPATATATAPRTLSSDGLLGRIDYLCTVSGGGYIGAMWARRVSQLGLRAAQNELARSDAPALHWLRRNGRYLTPAGSRDIGVGVVTYLRAWFAIHTEFMFASLCLGLLVMAPHLWQHSTGGLNVPGWSPWVTPWWVAALGLWVMAAPGLIAGYWVARDQPARATAPQAGRLWRNLRWRDALCMALLAALAYGLLRHWLVQDAMSLRRHGLNAPLLAALALVSAVLGTLGAQLVLALATAEHALAVAQLRNTFTQALRVAAVAALSLAGLGALDALSWWLLQELHTGNPWLWSGMGLGGAAVVLLRSLAQPLQHIAAEAGAQARAWLPRLLNLAGLIGLGVLVTAWLVLAQWFVFAPQTFDAFTPLPAALRAAVLAAVWALWVVLTAGNAQMANSSSLHHFYRARITRAYLAVGNPARQLDGHEASADVTRVTEGDDTALTHHRPETRGGPIHLITTCLNQTRDDRSGLYNADRKGVALTASWRGLELGPDQFIAAQPDHDLGTLGRWVAVSGAAASPGAGAYTSRGLALLVYLLGVRMGHWMRAPSGLRQGGVFTRLAWACLPKPLMLASEASATFHGPHRPWWYLSDGGHFENTGVYALLKRELDFIILSDAGCDTHYQFGDIENLVRKARIDFGAEIDFYTREEAARLFPSATQAPAAQARASGKAHCDGQTLTVLSPEDLADNHSCRGVLLARIRYRERNRPGPHGAGQRYRPEGTLLLVKPNLHNALDVDVLAYARQHETFPQEPTGDQSFDEAQWESYHRLGQDFGRALHEPWLSCLPGWRSPAQHPIDVAARLKRTAENAAPSEPLWRRTARVAALGTTLGVGASGTLLLALWQAQDQLQRNRADQQNEARQLLANVTQGLQDFNGSCPSVNDTVVNQTAVLLDLRASPALRPLDRAGLDRLIDHLSEQCAQPANPVGVCLPRHQRMHSDLCAQVLRPTVTDTALNYWSPAISPAEQAAAAQRFWHTVAARGPAARPTPPTAPPLREACWRSDGGFNRIYLQIYDEASRRAATAFAQQLKAEVGAWVQVAPLDNVTRSAELRGQRRPVPWAQPTWVAHDTAAHRCAHALAQHLGPGEKGAAWVRSLPPALPAQAGVMELWWPPSGAMAATP